MNDIFDLKEVFKNFDDIGEKRWGITLQLDLLEKVFKPIKEGKEELSIIHLKKIKKDWAFLRWWKMPEMKKKDFDPLIRSFLDIGPDDSKLIEDLFDLLKNIEIVSCVLRFVEPRYYGIFSPPVENLLNVRGKNHIDKYLNYLRNLKELQNYYDFKRIADVDMALWALANIINFEELRHHSIYSSIFNKYEYTSNPVKKIMARNSLEHIKKEAPLYKAELFIDSDYILAGIIAGRELELFIKKFCKKKDIKLIEMLERNKKRYKGVGELSDELVGKHAISRNENNSVHDWWEKRCDLVHHFEVQTTEEETKDMVEGIKNFITQYKPQIP